MPLYYPPEPELCSTQGCPHNADPQNSRGLCPKCDELDMGTRLEALERLAVRNE